VDVKKENGKEDERKREKGKTEHGPSMMIESMPSKNQKKSHPPLSTAFCA
jgi:hypothetical protein